MYVGVCFSFAFGVLRGAGVHWGLACCYLCGIGLGWVGFGRGGGASGGGFVSLGEDRRQTLVVRCPGWRWTSGRRGSSGGWCYVSLREGDRPSGGGKCFLVFHRFVASFRGS